jgi:hypothetical protein
MSDPKQPKFVLQLLDESSGSTQRFECNAHSDEDAFVQALNAFPEMTVTECEQVIIDLPAAPRSISDDDLCAKCRHCDTQPNDLSFCHLNWPGKQDADGYIVDCEAIDPTHV